MISAPLGGLSRIRIKEGPLAFDCIITMWSEVSGPFLSSTNPVRVVARCAGSGYKEILGGLI